MVDKINHYSLNNPASIYDEEAMTALELSARTAGKVNECVEAVNEIPDIVKEDIDGVLNSGEFDVLLDRKTNGLVSRVDALLSRTPTGSTTMDAEIVDARQDADGYNHANLGNAVRDASKQVEREISKFIAVNRLDPDTAVSGYLQGKDVIPSETYVTTDYIAVKAGETIGLFYRDMTPVPFRCVSLYDKAKNFVAVTNTNVLSYTVAKGIGFVRVTLEPIDKKTADYMITSEDATSWVAYGNATIAEKSIPDTMRNFSETFAYTNRYSSSYEEDGVYVNYTSGLVQENTNYVTTGYIRVTDGEKLSFYNEGVSVLPVRMGAYYDAKGTHVGGFSNTLNVITVPAGVRYIRVSLHKDYYAKKMMLTAPGAYKFVEPGEVCVRKDMMNGETVKQPKTAIIRTAMLSRGDELTLPDFPHYISGDFTMTFSGVFTTSSNMSDINQYGALGIEIGKGGENDYGSEWFTCRSSSVIHYLHTTDTTSTTKTALASPTGRVTYILTVKGGKYSIRMYTVMPGSLLTVSGDIKGSFAGVPFVRCIGAGTITNATLSITANLDSDVWMFGDSYLGWATNRVCGALTSYGVKGYLVDAMSGQTSDDAHADLVRAMNYGKPKTLVWYLGMNDPIDVYQQYLNMVEELCDKEGIELVINATPSPSASLDKSQHATLARTSGYRFIPSDSYIDAMFGVDTDGVHPNVAGAYSLAGILLSSVPELGNYISEV